MASSRSSAPVTPYLFRLLYQSRRAGQQPGRTPLLAALAALALCLALPILAGPAPAWAMAIPSLSPSNDFTVKADGTVVDGTGAVLSGNTSQGVQIRGRDGVGGVDGAPMTVTVESGATFGPDSISEFYGGNANNAGGADNAAGGNLEVRLSDRTTFAKWLSLYPGAGANSKPGGDLWLNDKGSAGPSVTTLMKNLDAASGQGGILPGSRGGTAVITLAGTLRFADNLPQDLQFSRGSASVGGAGYMQVDIGTLEATAGSTVNMGLGTVNALVYTTDNRATGDWVDFHTLKLNGGGTFATASSVGWFAGAPYASNYAPGAQYTVQNVTARGWGNVWSSGGVYAPAATGGTVTMDVTGVPAGLAALPAGAMLRVNNAAWNFSGFNPTASGLGNPNFVITGDTSDHQALVGRTFTMIGGTSNPSIQGQWAGGAHYRYYEQAGSTRYFYDTFVDPGDNTRLNAMGLGPVSAAKAYTQYQAGVAETVADIFLNNTWSAINDATATAKPGGFSVTGRVSYFYINQEQGHDSDVDKGQFAAALSAGYKIESGAGQTTLGAFLEYGHGEYDTDTTVGGWGAGQGLFGGGFFAHHEFTQGTYLDAGARVGTVSQNFHIKGLEHGSEIDTDTMYWGLNLGVGHKLALTERVELDLYGKFQWLRLEDDSYSNGYGERIQMDAVDSLRTRVGTRANMRIGDNGAFFYCGAAWEQEWDGGATGKLDGRSISEAADNSGASAFGEAGIGYKSKDGHAGLELGLFGLAGAQTGGGGTVVLKLEF